MLQYDNKTQKTQSGVFGKIQEKESTQWDLNPQSLAPQASALSNQAMRACYPFSKRTICHHDPTHFLNISDCSHAVVQFTSVL